MTSPTLPASLASNYPHCLDPALRIPNLGLGFGFLRTLESLPINLLHAVFTTRAE